MNTSYTSNEQPVTVDGCVHWDCEQQEFESRPTVRGLFLSCASLLYYLASLLEITERGRAESTMVESGATHGLLLFLSFPPSPQPMM